MAVGWKRHVMFSGVGGFDGDAVTGLHGFDVVLVCARDVALPDSLFDEVLGVIGILESGADKPAGASLGGDGIIHGILCGA